MSKFDFILFSDFHAHNFSYGSTRVPIPGFNGLYNSRLRDAWNVLDEIHKYAKENGIRNVLFGGDLYHSRLSVSTDVRAVVTKKLAEMAQDKAYPLFIELLVGNHDMGDKHGFVHSLVGLDQVPNIDVHDTFKYELLHNGVLSGPKLDVVYLPYTSDIEAAKLALQEAEEIADRLDNKPLLIAHLGMQGARVGSDYVLISESDIKVEDIQHDKFAACFFGHFHEHQKIFPNGWFIGATHEHNWGDSGGSRGFLHATIENGVVSFKQVQTQAPRFLTVLEGESTDYVRSVDFVKFVGSPDWLDEVKNLDVAHGEYTKPAVLSDSEFALDTTKLDPKTAMKQWAEAKAPEAGLDVSEVIDVGNRLLSRVDV